MKIFLTVSKTGVKKYHRKYYAVLQELERQGAIVEATFVKTYLNKKPNLKKVKDLSISENTYRHVHDFAVRKSIFRSDGVVIEASYPSFRLGFEAFYALSQQKPVLVLSTLNNYAHLIDQPNFFGSKYSDFTLPDEIEKFINHVKKYKLRNRFNLFISEKQKEHLGNLSRRYGVSMSDYLRGLIDKDSGNL